MSRETRLSYSPPVLNIVFTIGRHCAQSLSSLHSSDSHTVFPEDNILIFFCDLYVCPELSVSLVFSDYNSTCILVSIMRAARSSHYAHVYIHNQNLLCIFWLYYLLTYLLTPWSRVLLEKLTGLQLVKRFPAFYETPKFITALTSAHHLSLS